MVLRRLCCRNQAGLYPETKIAARLGVIAGILPRWHRMEPRLPIFLEPHFDSSRAGTRLAVLSLVRIEGDKNCGSCGQLRTQIDRDYAHSMSGARQGAISMLPTLDSIRDKETPQTD